MTLRLGSDGRRSGRLTASNLACAGWGLTLKVVAAVTAAVAAVKMAFRREIIEEVLSSFAPINNTEDPWDGAFLSTTATNPVTDPIVARNRGIKNFKFMVATGFRMSKVTAVERTTVELTAKIGYSLWLVIVMAPFLSQYSKNILDTSTSDGAIIPGIIH